MATLNRRDALAGLKTTLEELAPATIITVVRTYTEIDITEYNRADLPLIEIQEPEEDADTEMTGQRSIQNLMVKLKVWFFDWAVDPDATIYEALMKAIRDKIGANFKVGNTVIACWVGRISKIGGEMPVWNFETDLVMKYYLNQTAA